MQSWIEVDKENLYTLKINCKGERTVGKVNKGINIEKIIGFKKLKIKIEKKEKKKRWKKEEKKKTNSIELSKAQRLITIKSMI